MQVKPTPNRPGCLGRSYPQQASFSPLKDLGEFTTWDLLNSTVFWPKNAYYKETGLAAIKHVLALQLLRLIGKQNLSKAETSRKMGTSWAALNRLLDPENKSVTLQTMQRAARVLGKHQHLTLNSPLNIGWCALVNGMHVSRFSIKPSQVRLIIKEGNYSDRT